MQTLTKSNNISNGIIFGLMAGLVYCTSLFVRYNYTTGNPIMLGILALLFYLIIIGILVFCGLKRKKEMGGNIEMKDAFQTIFIAILLAELIYSVFNFIYLTYIDPQLFEKFKSSMIAFIENSGLSIEQKEKQLESIEKQFGKQAEKLTGKGIFLSYLLSVAITGVFGLLISLIIKKKKPVFHTDQLDMH